ncbi:hypothetical protein Tco_1255540, partial [Tanacetum coccineum]
LRDVAVYYHFAISTFPVKIVIKSSAFILEYLLQLHIQGDNTVLHDNTVLQDNNVIEQLMAQSGMDLKMAKTCYHSHCMLMSTPDYIYPIIILSDSNVEDTFSSTHSPDYIPALSDYSLASPRNTSPNFSDDLTKELLSSLSILLFHDDPYMKIIQAYDTIQPLQISSPKDTETPISPSSSVGSSSPVRSTTSSPDYPFDKILESCKRHRTQKQQGRTTRLEFSRIQPLDV